MLLEAKAVNDIFEYCLYKHEEVPDGIPPDDSIFSEGIINNVGFHPGRIAEHKADIAELLNQLAAPFHHDIGGGSSFLAMCEDKEGRQWTGEHNVVEKLVHLGQGVGLLHLCAPRKLWALLPGAMPYYVIRDTPPPVTDEDKKLFENLGDLVDTAIPKH